MAQRYPGAGPIRKKRRTKRKLAGAAVVATIFALLLLGDAPLYLISDHYAGVGASQRITLGDGSRIELNSRTAVALRFSGAERRILLLEGEAWFDVAPDASRPFVVEAAGGTVTALGTAFDASLDRNAAQVVVGQQSVAIASGGRSVLVEEGQQSAYATGAAARAPTEADLDRVSAWRRGQLMFENETLGEVVDALGRYRRGLVYFVNPALRARRVTGVFRIDDPLAALRQIEISLGLHAVYLTKYMIIIKEYNWIFFRSRPPLCTGDHVFQSGGAFRHSVETGMRQWRAEWFRASAEWGQRRDRGGDRDHRSGGAGLTRPRRHFRRAARRRGADLPDSARRHVQSAQRRGR
ncbi:FecR family protein [Methylosinus sp. H3A]|uniref:FecR family protein n=1 Tax=Methylosinus sp. H3A TaxID=2785786 RepID=UPI001FED61D5|nr:FecR domain-containing protein [Methylosinus sp. H3A]